MVTRSLFALAFFAFSLSAAFAQVIKPVPPDDRFKADILVVVAHTDDETEVTGYLARAVFDEHKRVAVIFGTRGDSGGDATGQEQAAALGAKREIEPRRALGPRCLSDRYRILGAPDMTSRAAILRSAATEDLLFTPHDSENPVRD